MSTIDSSDIIRMLLKANGKYRDDPPAFEIYSYTNMEGRKTCAVYWNEAQVDIHNSPYVTDPTLLWSRKNGLTFAGKLWLQEHK